MQASWRQVAVWYSDEDFEAHLADDGMVGETVEEENEYLQAARAANFGRIDWSAAERVTRAAMNLPAAEFRAVVGKAATEATSGRDARRLLVTRYSWAIPNERTLKTLAKYAPLIEIGAGTGYWAYLLRQMGVDILAFDTQPPLSPEHRNHYHRRTEEGVVGTIWTDMRRGGTPQAANYPERTLFLCWPPYDSLMAYNALRQYTGSRVAYLGEGQGGCTGDDRFHALLERGWEQIDSAAPPHWDGIHDYLTIYKRIEAVQ